MKAEVVRFGYGGRTFVFRHPPGDHIARAHKAGVFYEQPLLQALQQKLAKERKGGIAIDVGAHVGNHSVFFGAVMDLPTLSLEPQLSLLSLLSLNLQCNDAASVGVMGIACGQRAEVVTLQAGPSGNTGMARVRERSMPAVVPTGGVLGAALVDLVPYNLCVRLLKVDAEGAEPSVLKGALGLLERWRPIVVLEAQTERELQEQRTLLAPLGYTRSQSYCATPTYIWSP